MTSIFLIHPSVHDIPSFLRYTGLEGFPGEVDLLWNDRNPDILFATEWIHYKASCFRTFSRLYPLSGIKVAYMGEALEGDANIFDYVIGFSKQEDERHFRLPAPQDMFHGFLHERENRLGSPDEALALLAGKKKFCNFLYSNPDAHPMRDTIFHAVEAYRLVDSLGRHLNNTGTPGTGYGHGHSAECVGLKAPYRFSIAAENAFFRGYTTEKVLTSLEAHTVPIYWGNPDIAEDVNPEAIIDVNAADSLERAVELVREIDSDNALWADMVSRPWFTLEQVMKNLERTSRYHGRMAALLSGHAGKQVPEGYHISLYRENYFKGSHPFDKGWRKLLGI